MKLFRNEGNVFLQVRLIERWRGGWRVGGARGFSCFSGLELPCACFSYSVPVLRRQQGSNLLFFCFKFWCILSPTMCQREQKGKQER